MTHIKRNITDEEECYRLRGMTHIKRNVTDKEEC